MKTVLTLIISFLITASFPAHSAVISEPDLTDYLSETQALVMDGRHREALDRFIWFHNHSLEYQQHIGSIRLSVALSSWKQLGQVYPPALSAMKRIRDEKSKLLAEGEWSVQLFREVVKLNETLEDDRRTIELFRKIDHNQEIFAKRCWKYVKETVLEAKAYDLIGKYIRNFLHEFGYIKGKYVHNRNMYKIKTPPGLFQIHNENIFVTDTLRLIAIAVELDDKNSAKDIQAKALELLNDQRITAAFND